MTTFLINPSERNILKGAGDRMPLGLLYLAKGLENKGHPVRVYDLNHSPEIRLISDIIEYGPTMIGVSCYTSPMVGESKRLLKKLRGWSKARIIVGGYHPSVMPNEFRGWADNVVVGEGESALEELIGNIGENFARYGNPANLAEVGRPAREKLDHRDYNLMMDGMRTATMITSRGCPNNCVFCGNMSRQVRYHHLAHLEEELEEIKKQDYQAVYFLDDVFTINRIRAHNIGKMAKEQGLKFRITTRANYLDEHLVKDLAGNGLDIASMGVESGNPEVLERCGKNQTKRQIREAVNMCYASGVKTKGFFIIGLPGETEKTANETIRFAEELMNLGMEWFDFYSLQCYPGTVLWKEPEKFGIKILTRDYTKYLQVDKDGITYPTCETTNLKADKIYELLLKARKNLNG